MAGCQAETPWQSWQLLGKPLWLGLLAPVKSVWWQEKQSEGVPA